QLGADGGRWILVGTGGSARAVAVAAAEVKAELHVLSRDAARARDFAGWARSRGAQAEPARGALEPDVAINATPLGLKETDPLPPRGVRHLPPPLAPRPAAVVPALRPAGAALRALSVVRRLARGAAGRPLRGVARRQRPRRRACAEIRRPASHRRGPR